MSAYTTTFVLLVLACSCAPRLTAPRGPLDVLEISVGAEPIEATRLGPHSNQYQARVPMKICNHGDVSLRVHWVEVGSAEHDRRVNYAFDTLRLMPGGCFEKVVTLWTGETAAYELLARVSDEAGEISWTVPRTFQVVNTELASRRAECAACDGDWGPHGMLGIVGCICRTGDRGATCYDGRECEGICLYDHFEVIREAVPARCDDDGRCSVTLATNRPVGTCSEFQWMFGCYSYIPEGTSDETPFVGAWRVPRICVD